MIFCHCLNNFSSWQSRVPALKFGLNVFSLLGQTLFFFWVFHSTCDSFNNSVIIIRIFICFDVKSDLFFGAIFLIDSNFTPICWRMMWWVNYLLKLMSWKWSVTLLEILCSPEWALSLLIFSVIKNNSFLSYWNKIIGYLQFTSKNWIKIRVKRSYARGEDYG